MDHFQLEPMPATETRTQRARRLVVREIQERQEDSRRVARLERDCQAFEARAWMIVSGPDLVDVRDPDDGLTLDRVLDNLADQFEGKDPFWTGRELTITQGNRVVAVLTGSRSGKAVVTRFDRR